MAVSPEEAAERLSEVNDDMIRETVAAFMRADRIAGPVSLVRCYMALSRFRLRIREAVDDREDWEHP